MHPIARVLAVAYVALAVLAGVVYVDMTATYVDVAHIENTIADHVAVGYVGITWTGNTSDTAHVLVYVNVTNPGRLTVGIQSVDFALHIDDPLDNRSWSNPLKLPLTFVQGGGFDQGHEPPIPVAPGETRTLVVPVNIDPSRMDRFNHPDAQGRLHPVVWNVFSVYKLLDGRVQDVMYLPPYYDPVGVLPVVP